MKLYGTFLCFGADVEPQVRLLSDFEATRLGTALNNADDTAVSDEERRRVYQRTFGPGVQWAVPCWLEPSLLAVIEDERIEKKTRVIAARIYQGMPYSAGRDLFEGPDAKDGGGKDGGVKAALDPVKPKPKRPSGGVKAKPPKRWAKPDAKNKLFSEVKQL